MQQEYFSSFNHSYHLFIYGVVADEPIVVSHTYFQINYPSLLDFCPDVDSPYARGDH